MRKEFLQRIIAIGAAGVLSTSLAVFNSSVSMADEEIFISEGLIK